MQIAKWPVPAGIHFRSIEKKKAIAIAMAREHSTEKNNCPHVHTLVSQLFMGLQRTSSVAQQQN